MISVPVSMTLEVSDTSGQVAQSMEVEPGDFVVAVVESGMGQLCCLGWCAGKGYTPAEMFPGEEQMHLQVGDSSAEESDML